MPAWRSQMFLTPPACHTACWVQGLIDPLSIPGAIGKDT